LDFFKTGLEHQKEDVYHKRITTSMLSKIKIFWRKH